MVLSHTVKPVGVGSPNPLDEETSPLRWMPCLEFRCIAALSPSGADMLYRIADSTDLAEETENNCRPILPFAPEERYVYRHVQSPRSRGAQCGIVAHPLNP